MFKLFMNKVKNQYKKKIRRLYSDRRVEYESNLFTAYHDFHGIIHERTTPYSLEMNENSSKKIEL